LSEWLAGWLAGVLSMKVLAAGVLLVMGFAASIFAVFLSDAAYLIGLLVTAGIFAVAALVRRRV
jgi:hypothetical protein